MFANDFGPGAPGCPDCMDGHCTMNCSSRAPVNVGKSLEAQRLDFIRSTAPQLLGIDLASKPDVTAVAVGDRPEFVGKFAGCDVYVDPSLPPDTLRLVTEALPPEPCRCIVCQSDCVGIVPCQRDG